jgi:carbon-monoxide dehydrogenase medium subunit
MKRFDYYQPQTLSDAFQLMETCKGGARYIAGGTDIIIRIKRKVIEPDALISLRGIDELQGVRPNQGLALGSMTRLRDMERHPDVARDYPALSQAVGWLANPQIRNVATPGGNLCNAAPSADCATPMLALEATVTLMGPGGKRDLPLSEFFTGPGQTCMEPIEILTELRLPRPEKGTGMSAQKIGRTAQDIAIANAAAVLVMENAKCRKCRIAVGAVAPTPLRLTAVESEVEGREIGPDLLDHVAAMVEAEVRPITDVRSTKEYRSYISGVLVKRAIQQAMENVR